MTKNTLMGLVGEWPFYVIVLTMLQHVKSNIILKKSKQLSKMECEKKNRHTCSFADIK